MDSYLKSSRKRKRHWLVLINLHFLSLTTNVVPVNRQSRRGLKQMVNPLWQVEYFAMNPDW